MLDRTAKFFLKEYINIYRDISILKCSKTMWLYRFIPLNKYIQIDDKLEQTKIYWEEVLYRTHIVCLLSLFKASRWMDSMDNNYNNYYGFCSNMRGLIESCADSYYTLRCVPLTIAKDFETIRKIIKKESVILFVCEDLENILLHYTQATKLTREQKESLSAHHNSEQIKEYINAKQIKEYIQSIDPGDHSVENLYAYLCGISHPAYEATEIFLISHDEETVLWGETDNMERQLVEAAASDSSEVIIGMLKVFYLEIMCVLNILNRFQIKQIHTNILVEEFEKFECWIETKQYIDDSFKRYLGGLSGGIYE